MLSNSFPKDPRRRMLWIEAIRPGQRDWEPAKSACVCSKHFALEHFNWASPLVVLLNEDAVPAPEPVDVADSLGSPPSPSRQLDFFTNQEGGGTRVLTLFNVNQHMVYF
ncbi:hypothetical protein MRX96_000960 [Rhipicephalus microplus]